MNAIRVARDAIVAHESPARVLDYVDKQMESLRQLGDQFILPLQFAWVAPILEAYTADTATWRAFVKTVRDKLSPRSPEYRDVQELYEKLGTRLAQQRILPLLTVAVDWAMKKGYIEDSFPEKLRYQRRCRADWSAKRARMLESHRKGSPTGRLTVEQREKLLAAFWEQLEAEVNHGEIPKP